MVTLEEIRQRFPNANHAPRVGCKYCRGTGLNKVKNRERFKVLVPPSELPCICIYVDHDMADLAAETLGETARKIRKELGA